MPEYYIWSWHLVRSLWAEVVILGAGMILILRLSGVIFRKARHDWFEEGTRGSLVFQFALLLPLLVSLLLVIFQTALIVQAKLVVNYAAFCAARSAITVIPAAIQAASTGVIEGEGQINTSNPSYPKMTIIRRAGALACAAISPPLSAGLALQVGVPSLTALAQTTATLLAVRVLFPPAGLPPQSSANDPLDYATRAQYALAPNVTTAVVSTEVHSAPDQDHSNYEMVTVTLNYKYFLTVPGANRIYGKPYLGIAGLFNLGNAYYLQASETYTLLAETDPTFPASQNPNVVIKDYTL